MLVHAAHAYVHAVLSLTLFLVHENHTDKLPATTPSRS